MRYLSLCSGIEAATVAWHPLGWSPVAFGEIEKFPSAVLAHHYPETPNLGDMTKHEQWKLGPGSIDLLVAGTPCQSFSVAGLRRGLADPRGNLALTYLAIADRLRPRWLVWENVPGVLSSSNGRDFGSFLGALSELGYGWAYRVLDAQFFGVAQRRRRVFVVGHAGDWRRAAAVLFERESLRGDPAPSREARQEVAGTLAARTGVCRNNHEHLIGQWWDGGQVAETLNQSKCGGAGVSMMPDKGNFGAVLSPVAHPVPYDLFQITAPVNRQNRQPGDPCHTLARDNAAHAAVAMVNMGGDKGGASIAMDGTSFTLSTREPHAVAFSSNMSVPDCQTDGTTPTVKCGGSDGGNPPAVAMVNMQGSKSNAVAQADGPSYTLNAMHGHDVHAVAIGFNPDQSAKTRSMGEREQQAPTLRAGAEAAVAFAQNQVGEVRCGSVLNTLNTNSNASGRNTPMVAQAMAVAVAPTLTAANDPSRSPQSAEVTQQVAAVHAATMAVRRLTPVECERLQGFPDGYTAIPWRGKPLSECPDGPRYRALGNSMAVPVMRWIGERIAKVDAIRISVTGDDNVQ